MPDESVPMDSNMIEVIESLRVKYQMLPTEDVIRTLLGAAIEQERGAGEASE